MKKIHPFIKAAGFKTEKEFYDKYKSPEDFFNEHPQFANGGITTKMQGDYNAYQKALLTNPAYNPATIDHNQTLQRQVAANVGFDYNQLPAIQKDIANRYNTIPGSVHIGKGINGVNGDGFMGSDTSHAGYNEFQYGKKGVDGKINYMSTGADPLSVSQMNNYFNPILPQSQPINETMNYSGFSGVGNSNINTTTGYQPIVSNTNTKREQKSNWHEDGYNDYSVDAVRQQYGNGGFIRKVKKMLGGGGVTPENPIPGAMDVPGTQTIQYQGIPSIQAPIDPNVQYNANYSNNSINPPTLPQQAPPKQHQSMGAGVTLSTAPLISGMNTLVTDFITNPRIHAQEANMLRRNAQSVQSNNNFIGGDMLTYRDGGMIDKYTVNPNVAQQEIENNEFVRTPDGKTDVAKGAQHNQINEYGTTGIPTNLPDTTQVFSDKIKVDKKFASDILGRKVNKNMSTSELAQQAKTKFMGKDIKTKLDPIATRTKDLNNVYTHGLFDQIFSYQEMIKNPMQSVAQMKYGGSIKQYADGGNAEYFTSPLTPQQQEYQNNLSQFSPQGPLSPLATEQQYLDSVNNKGYSLANNIYGMSNTRTNVDGILGPRTELARFMVQNQVNPYQRDNIDRMPYINDNSGFSTGKGPTLPTGDYYSTQEMNVPNAEYKYYDNPVNNSRNQGIVKKGFKMGNNGMSELVPQGMAAINALTDFPINNMKYNPEYPSRPEELNIDPILNRNYALAKPGLNGNSGNRSVDQARALQTLAATQEADNSAYMNKFNTDSTNKTNWRDKVSQIKNQAQLVNLQNIDRVWDKMSQRDANKKAAFQEIANNAFSNAQKRMVNNKKAEYDKNSQTLYSQLAPHYIYNPSTGFYVDPNSGISVHESTFNNSYNTPDEVTTTKTTDSKGKTKIQRKEKTKN